MSPWRHAAARIFPGRPAGSSDTRARAFALQAGESQHTAWPRAVPYREKLGFSFERKLAGPRSATPKLLSATTDPAAADVNAGPSTSTVLSSSHEGVARPS